MRLGKAQHFPGWFAETASPANVAIMENSAETVQQTIEFLAYVGQEATLEGYIRYLLASGYAYFEDSPKVPEVAPVPDEPAQEVTEGEAAAQPPVESPAEETAQPDQATGTPQAMPENDVAQPEQPAAAPEDPPADQVPPTEDGVQPSDDGTAQGDASGAIPEQ